MKLLLFDIDGTLMLSGGAGKRALTEIFGLADPLASVRLNGQTEPPIVTDARRELVPVERARQCFGVPLSIEDAIVIGDTEKDVVCGRHCGARTVAVPTGGISEEILRGAGPDVFFPTLEDTRAVVQALVEL